MLYYLFEFLESEYSLTGASVFQYISFRAALSVITSLLITMVFGKRIIQLLIRKQVGETVRNLGLDGEAQKEGTPTMGGLIILTAILVPVLLFAKLDNIYVILLIISTLWLGAIGFLDDYIKVFKKDKKGLAGRFKILGQVVLGLIVGIVLYVHPEVVIKEKHTSTSTLLEASTSSSNGPEEENIVTWKQSKSFKTTIPFFKNNEFDYSSLINFLGDKAAGWTFLIFIPIVILIVTAVSNGVNITDGLDGLATGTSAIIGASLGILSYVSGNMFFADYLNIMYIPQTGELVIFISAFVGACVGFLWYNSYPAQVFMGDTGSLALGGIIAVFAIVIRKELLIPILCGVFLVENLSVMIQVGYFKYTKKKFGEGRRIFKMAPLHHHYQKLGFNESKIVTRFWIITVMLAVLTLVTLKLR
ncbi:MAG TPA: phospho-N-acetylmuramoyl-pentapeptide-transferase [Flavobacteriales bacterium]|nr:phospho-N-acetylmuramoyl-pentapeptide-transferase [Flavobacteriales bacterium]HIN38960.1 phospho-N-acetylmuramoyl-pentapeptide-transferase [Flavobacteriales bacterium]